MTFFLPDQHQHPIVIVMGGEKRGKLHRTGCLLHDDVVFFTDYTTGGLIGMFLFLKGEDALRVRAGLETLSPRCVMAGGFLVVDGWSPF